VRSNLCSGAILRLIVSGKCEDGRSADLMHGKGLGFPRVCRITYHWLVNPRGSVTSPEHGSNGALGGGDRAGMKVGLIRLVQDRRSLDSDEGGREGVAVGQPRERAHETEIASA
jgi:hypothetical protein